MHRTTPSARPLERTLGLPSLIAVGAGIVIGQGAFVSILQGVGINATGFLVAMLIAFALTITSVFTFAELSLMMPRAGSISTYTEVAIGHLPAIVVTLAGYVGPIIFAGPADLFLLEHILDVLYPDTFRHVGLWIYGAIIVANLRGIHIFAAAQNILAFVMLAALLVVGLAGLGSTSAQDIPLSTLVTHPGPLDLGVLSLTVLALWAFLGLEFMCPLIEETRRPERNIPRAMMITACILLLVYGLVALAGYRKVPGQALVDSPIPHWVLVDAIFGRGGRLLMAVLAITAAASTFNTATAAVARMLYGMAMNGQLPRVFSTIHARWGTPWINILVIAGLTTGSYAVFANLQDAVILLMISAATAWLLVYVVCHINVIVLRRRYPRFHRPYRSPWHPIPQVVGITGMVYLLVNNSPSPEMTRDVYLNAGLLIGVVAVYAALWVTLKMKKRLFAGAPIDDVV